MTNPYRSPDPLNEPISPPTPSAKRMRRAGRLCILLGIVGLLLGPLCTAWGMVRASIAFEHSGPSELAGDLASAISTALAVSIGGIAVAAILLPLGIVLLVQAARARRRQEE
jgi:biopolymer transport protein ExbB/TolQ